MKYNWELPDWADFKYSLEAIETQLYAFALETGAVTGILKSLPKDIREASLPEVMLSEAIKTSEIEGEFLNRQDVMSSIRNNLGLNETRELVRDEKSKGIGALMVDVRRTYQEPLTVDKLWDWHKLLLGSSLRIRIGQ